MDVLRQLLPLLLMTAVLYLILIVPQNKKKKEFDSMMASLQVNDEVVTRGGIIGTIASVHEDSFILQTGPDKTTVRIAKAAIYEKVKDTAVKEPVKEQFKEGVEEHGEDVKVEENKEF
jgi:preprotein translocase subunit YajC